MKTSAVFGFLIFVISIQTDNADTQYDVCDLKVYLERSEERFVQLATSNPDRALNISTQDLTQALTIAAQLFNRSEITPEEAVDEIMKSLTDALNATLHVPRVYNITQEICGLLNFRYPDAITNETQFERFTIVMTMRVYNMCMDLGLPSKLAEAVFRHYRYYLILHKLDFHERAEYNCTEALYEIQLDLGFLLNLARIFFEKGLFPPEKVVEDTFQFISEKLLAARHVNGILNWVYDACVAKEIPFSEAIDSDERLIKFTTKLNMKLPRLCSDYDLPFGPPLSSI